jgi:uncharacterized protein
VTVGLQLGRPGVIDFARPVEPPLDPVRLNVAGFVGVALRGPVDTPVLVTSWSSYERVFGGYERAPWSPERLLPHAVNAFLEQGGRRAWVVRVTPAPDASVPTAEQATARFALDHPAHLELVAADEGTWGSDLDVRLEFEAATSFAVDTVDGRRVPLPPGVDPPDHSLVRVRRPDLPATGVLRVLRRLTTPALARRFAELDEPLPARVPAGVEADEGDEGDQPVELDLVTGTLVVADRSSAVRREERFAGLGLVPGHPRHLPIVLNRDSALVRAGDWGVPMLPDPYLTPVVVLPVHPGLDRNHGIDGRSFFDDGPADADLLDEQETHRGADALGRVEELGLLCCPDLTWRAEAPPPNRPATTPRPPSKRCDPCASDHEPELAEPPPVPTGLDGRDPASLAEIVARQARLVEIADLRERFVALLDVPLGIPLSRVAGWRSAFDSSYAAAYFPWLGVVPPGSGDAAAVSVPPSAFASGIIAAREHTRGIAWGPANELAAGAVVARESVTDTLHDRLHLVGINVYRAERDGFRLSAARTLARDQAYRQLSVRRLMTMIRLTITQQCQWLVFEPNTADLRRRLASSLDVLLRGLHRRGFLAGRTEAESYFVRCDNSNNPPRTQALGRLVAEVGVAPAEPLEYLVLVVSTDTAGGVRVEERVR